MAGFPGFAGGLAARSDGAPVIDNILRNFERRMRPSNGGAGAFNFLTPQRGPMHAGRARFGRCAIANHGTAADQAWPIIFTCRGNGVRHGLHVMPVNGQNLPAIGFETACGVVGNGQIGAAIDRNAIIVEQHNHSAKLHMACHGGGFMADAFHQTAIASNHIGVMVDKVAAIGAGKVTLCHGYANRIGKSLTKRAGGGLDPGRMAIFRMAGGDCAKLAEIADLLHRHVGIARQMQQRIDQHRSVSGRQDETVPVRPVGRGRIKFQVISKQGRRRVSHAHRHARVTRFCCFNSVHCQGADRICHLLPVRIVCHEKLRWDQVGRNGHRYQ